NTRAGHASGVANDPCTPPSRGRRPPNAADPSMTSYYYIWCNGFVKLPVLGQRLPCLANPLQPAREGVRNKAPAKIESGLVDAVAEPRRDMPLHPKPRLAECLNGLMHPRNRQHVVGIAMDHQDRRAAAHFR